MPSPKLVWHFESCQRQFRRTVCNCIILCFCCKDKKTKSVGPSFWLNFLYELVCYVCCLSNLVYKLMFVKLWSLWLVKYLCYSFYYISNMKWLVKFFHFRFFDKKFESVTVEYPICSGEMIDICKVSFADWVIAISMNAYFITYFW